MTQINAKGWQAAETSAFERRELMDVKVAENLWTSSMLPEGIVERWLVSDGAMVNSGEPLVEIRIEDALHEIVAPISGRLTIRALTGCGNLQKS